MAFFGYARNLSGTTQALTAPGAKAEYEAMFTNWSAAAAGLILFIGVTRGAEAPSKERMLALAAECRAALGKSLIDFYLPGCVDRDLGGYKEYLKDGVFVNQGEKFLVLQARHLWLFSTLAGRGIETNRTLGAAQAGFEFLEGKMRDREHGGYFSKVTDAGEAKDARKHAYLNAFAIYALTAHHQATGSQLALSRARELFQLLEKRAHDPRHGGYHEWFRRDWTLIQDPAEPSFVGAAGRKTFNTHLHLLEAFAALHRAWPDPLLRKRLHELIVILTSTILQHSHGASVDAFTPDWSPVMEARNLRASYGHDIEAVWLTLDAADAIGLPRAPLRNWAETLAANCLANGSDAKHGGFYEGGPLGKPADALNKTWWVQNEAAVGLLELFRLTGDPKYYAAFEKTLRFQLDHHIASEGGWWATRAADGSPTRDTTRTGPWQGGYHAGRALLLCADWLEAMAQ